MERPSPYLHGAPSRLTGSLRAQEVWAPYGDTPACLCTGARLAEGAARARSVIVSDATWTRGGWGVGGGDRAQSDGGLPAGWAALVCLCGDAVYDFGLQNGARLAYENRRARRLQRQRPHSRAGHQRRCPSRQPLLPRAAAAVASTPRPLRRLVAARAPCASPPRCVSGGVREGRRAPGLPPLYARRARRHGGACSSCAPCAGQRPSVPASGGLSGLSAPLRACCAPLRADTGRCPHPPSDVRATTLTAQDPPFIPCPAPTPYLPARSARSAPRIPSPAFPGPSACCLPPPTARPHTRIPAPPPPLQASSPRT